MQSTDFENFLTNALPSPSMSFSSRGITEWPKSLSEFFNSWNVPAAVRALGLTISRIRFFIRYLMPERNHSHVASLNESLKILFFHKDGRFKNNLNKHSYGNAVTTLPS